VSGRLLVTMRRDGAVAQVTLSRAEKLNALAQDMRQQLRDRIVEAARDKQITALLITGEGKAFCAGGDIDAMAELRASGNHRQFHQILHAGAECVLALQAFPGVTVAAINGVAAGAGFALALNCDLRVAADTARLAASWSNIGLAPDWGASFWLPQLVGYSRALELVISGREVDSAEALRLGLVHEVVAPGEVRKRALELAQRGAAHDMVRQTKYLLRRGLEGSLESSLAAETEAQEDLFAGEDALEGLQAFRDRRQPLFGGRK